MNAEFDEIKHASSQFDEIEEKIDELKPEV